MSNKPTTARSNIPLPKGYNGTIDLNQRKPYYTTFTDPDTGVEYPSVQTEYSVGVGYDPGDNYSILIPTVIDGKAPVDQGLAMKHFEATGKHLGIKWRHEGESVEDFYKRVEKYANEIHLRQAKAYPPKGGR